MTQFKKKNGHTPVSSGMPGTAHLGSVGSWRALWGCLQDLWTEGSMLSWAGSAHPAGWGSRRPLPLLPLLARSPRN